MEMEMEVGLEALVERLSAAAGVMEQAAERLAGVDLAAGSREAELERRLHEAEATIASLKASAAGVGAGLGRKTSATSSLVAREGVALEAGALDAALTSLSLEQRIAVKAQLMRSGLLG